MIQPIYNKGRAILLMPLFTTIGNIIPPLIDFVIITSADSQKLRNVFAWLMKAKQDVDRTNRPHFHRGWMQQVSSGTGKLLFKLFLCEQTITIKAQKTKYSLISGSSRSEEWLSNGFTPQMHQFCRLALSHTNIIWVKGLNLLALFCL